MPTTGVGNQLIIQNMRNDHKVKLPRRTGVVNRNTETDPDNQKTIVAVKSLTLQIRHRSF